MSRHSASLAREAAIGVRFIAGLPRFLRSPFDLPEARRVLAARRAQRPQTWLAFVRRAVYGVPDSPYRALLDHAGCSFADLAALTKAAGVEGALARIAAAGVYLAVEELKGRRPIRRGSLVLETAPGALVNPRAHVHGIAESGGSGGPRTAVPIDLAAIRDHAVDTHLTLAAHGGAQWIHAHWGVPGGTAVTNLLEFAVGGRPAARWFSPVDPATPGLHPRYRLGARALRWTGRAAGVPLPAPETVPLGDPAPIARWMRSVLDQGQVPHLWTFASSAVLVCQAAEAAGIDLTGARFTMGGEPTTRARRETVLAAGAVPLPRYGTTETDILAFACRAPDQPDDMHVIDDRHALSAAPPTLEALPAGALLVSSLLPTAPIVLLNASLGDRATLSERACGCPLAKAGWARHVADVRSWEKLTAGGIMFVDTDVVRVLEETLPQRFGGTAIDYQLVEEEGRGGAPRVRLVVDPGVGPVDAAALVEAFLTALGQGVDGERLMALQWRDAGVLRVERSRPRTTPSGKILHLHSTIRGRPNGAGVG